MNKNHLITPNKDLTKAGKVVADIILTLKKRGLRK
jgi:hypothetical protein